MADLKSTGWVKYASTDITADDAAPTETSASLPAHWIDCSGFRSARIRFYADSDNATFTDITIYLIARSSDADPAGPTSGSTVMYHTKQLCQLSGTIRAGSVTGVAGGNATAGENYVGLVGTNTVSPWGTKLMNHVNGIIDVHNVDDEVGELFISDLANADMIHIQFDVATATLANAEVHLDV
jgi:hypothetical protein